MCVKASETFVIIQILHRVLERPHINTIYVVQKIFFLELNLIYTKQKYFDSKSFLDHLCNNCVKQLLLC